MALGIGRVRRIGLRRGKANDLVGEAQPSEVAWCDARTLRVARVLRRRLVGTLRAPRAEPGLSLIGAIACHV
jgi:hypothetical protein